MNEDKTRMSIVQIAMEALVKIKLNNMGNVGVMSWMTFIHLHIC
jgi:hypothetical protein